MKLVKLTIAALALTTTAAFAGPTKDNAVSYPNGISYAEFLAVNGCTLVDKGGYSNARGPDGGGCTALVDWSRSGGGYLADTDGDGTVDTWVGSDY